MRTSHLTIRKRVLEEKSKITDEEFFTSKEYCAYLTDLTEASTKKYGRPLKVIVYADPNDPTVAYIDPRGIFINACNHITWSMPSRYLRSLSIEGLNAHENGHDLFTDNRIARAYFNKLLVGKYYPKKPTGLRADHKVYAKEILEAMLDETDEVPKTVIVSTAKALSNILEDGYVDARSSYEFPGTPARGIALNNLRFAETVPDIETMINKKFYDHNIVLNLLIQYVRAREVNNLSGYSGEILDKFMSYIPLVDSCIFDEDARARFEAVNQIMIDLWPMMQRCFDDLRDKKQQAQQNQQQQSAAAAGSGNGSGSSGGSSDEESKDAGIEAVKEALESQLPKAPVNFTGKTGAVPSNGSFVPDKDQEAALLAQMERVLSEETARIAAHKTNSIESVGDGGVTQDGEYEGYGYGHAAEDIERLLEHMAQGRVNEAMEEELSEELQREADSIRYGNAHRNIHVTVHRMAQVDQTLVDSYSSVAPQLLLLSKRLQRSVSPILRDKRQGGKQTGLYVGKRLNQHAFHRDDGRIFCNTGFRLSQSILPWLCSLMSRAACAARTESRGPERQRLSFRTFVRSWASLS